MTGTEIVLILGALGVGGAVTQIVASLLGRRKANVDATVSLNDASIKLIETYRQSNADLSEALTQLRQEMAQVEHKLDQVLGVVDDERQWARAGGHFDAPVLRVTKIGGSRG